jgi:type II secretory ATPase GspE/PulE/Tfp pilus assembly ATPase PilB-like protein
MNGPRRDAAPCSAHRQDIVHAGKRIRAENWTARPGGVRGDVVAQGDPMVWSGLVIAAVPAGGYINAWKLIPLLLVLLIWGRLVTWIDKDAPEVMLPRIPLNVGNLLAGILAFFLFFMLPGFAVGLLVMILVILIDVGVYLGIRNSKVGLGDLGSKFTDWINSFKGGEKVVKVVQGEVQFIGKGGGLLPPPASDDPSLAAYEATQSILTDPLRRSAERIDLIPVDGSAAVRYTVDGVTYSGATLDKSRAAGAIEYFKGLANLDVNERRKPQSGNARVSIDGAKRDLQVETRGSTAGEQLKILVDEKKRHSFKIDELGLSEAQLETVTEVLRENQGVVLVGAPRGQGLTSMLYAILRGHDAFLQHIHTVESEPEADLEGITQNRLPHGPGEEAKTIDWTISQEPDVILVPKVDDPKAAALLSKFAGEEGKRVYIGMRAGSTFEALSQWRKLIGDDRQAMKNLRMIIVGRVVRKLCGACKAGYTPDPGTLRKLNMDPDKVGKLYQARSQPMRDAKGNPVLCEFCKELYFKGRVGVYEIFLIDNDVKQVVEAGGSQNQLKAVFRKQRGKYLQEAALAQVEAGETSVQEVLRVMKSDEQRPPGSPSSGARRSA